MKVNKIKSFAKLNLSLNITGKTSSLHKIETMVAFVSLHDDISIRKIKSPNVDMDTRWRNTQDSIQTYFKQYEAHFLDFRNRTQSEELFSELMKSDLKFCLEILTAMTEPQEEVEASEE